MRNDAAFRLHLFSSSHGDLKLCARARSPPCPHIFGECWLRYPFLSRPILAIQLKKYSIKEVSRPIFKRSKPSAISVLTFRQILPIKVYKAVLVFQWNWNFLLFLFPKLQIYVFEEKPQQISKVNGNCENRFDFNFGKKNCFVCEDQKKLFKQMVSLTFGHFLKL